MRKYFFIGAVWVFIMGYKVSLADTTDVVQKGYALAQKQYTQMLQTCTDLRHYPRSADANGNTSFTDIRDWTGGFWPGILWYVYEYTHDEQWKNAALRWTESLKENQWNTNHHDIGFVMNCSYGNAYRITGDTAYKSIIIQSAKSLITRYNPKVGAIKSWNSFPSWDGKSVYQFPVIIDNMMNLELLFLASRLSGDNTFRDIAIKHAETTLKNHYRADYSSYHVVNYDPQTGKVLSKETAQGFADHSAWARGQAWGLYGFTLMYRETKDKKYLKAAIKMAMYYINHPRLPADKVPYWDFNAQQEGYRPNWSYDPAKFKEIPRDASAAAITSSALLELVGYSSGKQQAAFRETAVSILQSLSSDAYSAQVGTNGHFLLKHSVGSIPHQGEIDVPLVYADYYYLEALKRLSKLQQQNRDTLMHHWQKMHASKEQALNDFQALKFGLFIHWGLYAIPGGVWQGKRMEDMGSPSVAEWIQLVAKIPRTRYARLADDFMPNDFDADAIVRMAKRAGMRYVVITSKHHDGFAMYDSEVSDFNVVKATPWKRDVIAELYRACKKHGIRFGVYYSQNIDWADGADAQYAETKAIHDKENKTTSAFGANLWDPSPNTYAAYLDYKAIPQVKELLTKFKDIHYIWFDMPGLMTPRQSYRFYKTVYDINPRVIISERIGNGMGDYAIPGDNRIPGKDDKITLPWEAIGTFNHSWGYKSYDNDWKHVDELLFWLLEIVSKGGNYMLNIGPDAAGTVAEPIKQNLQAIGDWMAVNGEAIYGTKPWTVHHEGPTDYQISDTEQREREGFKAVFTPQDFWFTSKKDVIYAMAMRLPENGKAKLTALKDGVGKVKKVEVLGVGKVDFVQNEDGLEVSIPHEVKALPMGYTLKINR